MKDQAPEAFKFATDRHFVVPAGKVVKTGYVGLWDVSLACRDKMAVGDVEGAYRRRLQLGSNQAWPCPYGVWQGTKFNLIDGRHEYVAALMFGLEHLLVAWLEDAPS